MSAIASFYLLDTTQLEQLRSLKDNYNEYLDSLENELPDNDVSGLAYALLPVLLKDLRGIDVANDEYADLCKELDAPGGTHMLFTNKQRVAFGDQLEPANFSLQEIQTFNEELMGEGDEDTAMQMLEALKTLHDHLNKIKDES